MAAHGHGALIGLFNCFVRRPAFGINARRIVFPNLSTKFRCIQSEMLVKHGFSMPHQDYFQASYPAFSQWATTDLPSLPSP